MNTKIVIESKIDAKVFKDFSFFNCFKLNLKWTGLVAFPIVMFFLAWLNLSTGSKFLCILFCILSVTMPALYLLFYKVSINNQIKKFKLETPQQVYTATIMNDGFHIKNAKESAIYKWEQIYRVYILKNYTYIYITKNRSFILPDADIIDCKKESLVNAIQNLTKKSKVFFIK